MLYEYRYSYDACFLEFAAMPALHRFGISYARTPIQCCPRRTATPYSKLGVDFGIGSVVMSLLTNAIRNSGLRQNALRQTVAAPICRVCSHASTAQIRHIVCTPIQCCPRRTATFYSKLGVDFGIGCVVMSLLTHAIRISGLQQNALRQTVAAPNCHVKQSSNRRRLRQSKAF